VPLFVINSGTSTLSITFANGSFGDDFFIVFSDFSDGGVAFTSVDSIMMTMSVGAGWDARIDFIETRPKNPPTVPEPASIAL